MLRSVDYKDKRDVETLYEFVKEMHKQPHVTLTKSTCPTFQEHAEFLKKKRYKYHCFYYDKFPNPKPLSWLETHTLILTATVTLTNNNEIGIFVKQTYQGTGVAARALTEFLKKYPVKGKITARVNKDNYKSNNFFQKMGFKHTGNIYSMEIL